VELACPNNRWPETAGKRFEVFPLWCVVNLYTVMAQLVLEVAFCSRDCSIPGPLGPRPGGAIIVCRTTSNSGILMPRGANDQNRYVTHTATSACAAMLDLLHVPTNLAATPDLPAPTAHKGYNMDDYLCTHSIPAPEG
jgi:hypothetical protein